jgi:hypothetical protein
MYLFCREFTAKKLLRLYVLLRKRWSKAIPLRHEGAKRERTYIFYSFLTSWVDWVVSVASRPPFTSEKGPPVPTGQKAGRGFRAGLDTEARGKILSVFLGSNRGVQSVVRHYTDWATPDTFLLISKIWNITACFMRSILVTTLPVNITVIYQKTHLWYIKNWSCLNYQINPAIKILQINTA